MKCAELVAMLEAVSPALSDHHMVPLMQHFWFMGDALVTFNDRQGMLLPCETPFKLAAPIGLLELLRASPATGKLNIKLDADVFQVGIGRHIAEFPFLPIDDCAEIFTMPDLSDGDLTLSKLGLQRLALQACLRSISDDTLRPELRGVTIIPQGEHLLLFSSSKEMFTRAKLKAGDWRLKERVTVPQAFCEIFLAMSKDVALDEKDVHLQITRDIALASVNGAMLYSKLIDVEEPSDFVGIYAENYKTDNGKRLLPIPEDLRMLLRRALVVSDNDADTPKSELQVKGNVLTYYSQSKRGVVDDEIDFEHPDVGPVKIASKLLHGGLNNYDKICINDDVVILTASERVCMISTS